MDPEEKNNQSFEWENGPLRHLILLAWPIAVSMVSYSVMSLVDTAFVSRLGTSAIAGVGLAITLSFALLCFTFGLLRAIKVLVSQSRGAGLENESVAYLGAGCVVALVLGVVLMALSPLVDSVLPYLSASESASDAASSYFTVRMMGVVPLLIFVAFREYGYGCGNSQLPMVASVAGNLLNIGLDYLFIFELEMGVAGAAWATVAGACLEASVMLVAMRGLLPQLRTMRRHHLKAIWDIGLPSGLQFTLEMGSFTLLAVMISRLDEVEMVSHQVALQVIHFAFLPAVAFGEAASVMVGEAVGASRDKLVTPISWLTAKLVTAYMVLCGVILVLFGREIASLFVSEAVFVERTMALFYVACVFLFFDGTNIVSRCVLRGIGDVRFPAVVGIISAWLFTPPLMWLLGYKMGLGALGGWIGLCLEVVLGTVILAHRLYRGGWVDAARESRERVGKVMSSVIPVKIS
ncbi:MAG: MATE family efflux transporter [Deltaproteobacteria bacterium]|nr:MATE family efflux transporter [Deltaproteobacteria bacterium]